MRRKLFIVTTVPDMLYYILKGQPKFLNDFFEVHLVTSSGQLVEKIKVFEGVKIHTIRIKRNISLFSDFYSLFQLIWLLHKESPDIVHSYSPKAGLISMLASKIVCIKHRFHTFTGLIFPSRSGLFRKLLMFMDRIICFCATEVIPESLGVADELVRNKIFNKPHDLIGSGNIAGVDIRFFRPLSEVEKNSNRQYYNIPKAAWVFCYVGRIHLEKGINELINAFSKIEGENYLILVGSEDQSSSATNAVKQAIEINSKIICTGWVEDIRIPLGCADVNILPSYREGFPNVLLQASAMAIPSIATDVNGSREIIQDDVTGWLIPIKNELELLKAMKKATKSRIECKRLGHEGVSIVKKKYDQVIYRKKLLEFYNKKLDI